MNISKVVSIICLALCIPVCSYAMKKKSKTLFQTYIEKSSAKLLDVLKKKKKIIGDISGSDESSDIKTTILSFVVSEKLQDEKKEQVKDKRRVFHKRSLSAEKYYEVGDMYKKMSRSLHRRTSSDGGSSSSSLSSSLEEDDFAQETSPLSDASANFVLQTLGACTSPVSDFWGELANVVDI